MKKKPKNNKKTILKKYRNYEYGYEFKRKLNYYDKKDVEKYEKDHDDYKKDLEISLKEISKKKLTKDIKANNPLMIDDIDHPYEKDSDFVTKIRKRGL